MTTTTSQTNQRRSRTGSGALVLDALKVIWLPWILARVLVGGALGLSRYEISHLGVSTSKAIAASHAGLLGWDASWYRAIATGGYGSVAHSGLRFFPLYPELLSGIHFFTRAPLGPLALLVSNAASLLAVLALYLLTRRELDAISARRAAWLLCLSPAAFVLVMGYPEALFLLFGIAGFFFLRSKRWWWAALAGLLIGVTRPTGLLFIIPALVEVWSLWKGASGKTRVAQSAAVLSPFVGVAVYLAWVGHVFGDAFAPFSIQTGARFHGSAANPLSVLWHASTDVLHGHVGTALHVPWIIIALLLAIVSFRRLPLSYALFGTAIVIVALSGSNLDSFERYALSAFPLTMTAGSLIRSERIAQPVFVLCGVGIFTYALLAFLGAYTP